MKIMQKSLAFVVSCLNRMLYVFANMVKKQPLINEICHTLLSTSSSSTSFLDVRFNTSNSKMAAAGDDLELVT